MYGTSISRKITDLVLDINDGIQIVSQLALLRTVNILLTLNTSGENISVYNGKQRPKCLCNLNIYSKIRPAPTLKKTVYITTKTSAHLSQISALRICYYMVLKSKTTCRTEKENVYTEFCYKYFSINSRDISVV